MNRRRFSGTAWCLAAGVAVVFGALSAGCDNSGGTPGGSCTQLLCEGGSSSCCVPALPGTWDPAAMGCNCPAPPQDADADVGDDDSSGADADADADADGDVTTDTSDPCYPYPCSPYSMALGHVIEDFAFTPVNDSAVSEAGDDGSFDMHDLYQANEAHGGNLKALFIFVTAGWCPVCAVEAGKLQALYNELYPQGAEFLAIITDGNTSGRAATQAEARAYATRYHWTFPAVRDPSGNVDQNFWPPADIASGSIGVPLNMFYDLRNMRLYGRFAGGVDMKLPRYFVTEILDSPHWTASFARDFNFDCAPGTGTESEPNSIGDTPEDGRALPYALSGAQCPPTVGDGMFIDEDDVDLGTLAAGTVIDANVTSGTGSNVYPFAQLVRVSGTTIAWANMGPSSMATGTAGRQWIIDTAGHYYLSVADGRQMSASYYGSGTPPLADQCCDGGPDYTYDLDVSPFTLAATDAAVAVGTSAAFTLDGGDLNVHPFDVTSGTTYNIRLIASDSAKMDPYLTVYDPATSTVLGFNDDETSGTNLNSKVTLTPTTTGTIWVVAGYWGAWFNGGPPAYTIQID